MNHYDVIIIGAGPAGLSAALYSGRARMNTLIIEKEKDGGQVAQTSEIENYPGGIEEETGPSLVKRMSRQADHFGAKKVIDDVVSVDFSEPIKKVVGNKQTYTAKSVIVAAGASPYKIGAPGEKEFASKGVSYCATCDGAFFEDFEVFVVGGGDSAVEEAIYLTRFARKVTIIHRRDELRAAKSIQEKAFNNEKIHFLWDSVVRAFKGDGLLSAIEVENVKTKERTLIQADEEDGIFGVFVFVGYKPQSDIFKRILDMDKGYIVTDEDMKTNVEGVFAAGDIRKKSLRQVVTAVADGAIAAVQAGHYVDSLE